MHQGRIKPKGKLKEHDRAFYFAIDETGNKVSATEALKIKQEKPNSVFYCPSCYKRNRKTIGIPQNTLPRHRFHRYEADSHLDDCPYNNPRKFLISMTQKLDIELDDQTLKLNLMPYEGKSVVICDFIDRLKVHMQEDHIKFIGLIEYLLRDYDMQSFYNEYSGLKIPFEGKSKSFNKLVYSTESVKETKRPYVDKLNIVVGTVNQLQVNSPYFVFHFEESGQHSFPFFIYVHDHFYDQTLLDQLIGKKVACWGYVITERDRYGMEILSIPHQIAFLTNDPKEDMNPYFDENRFLDELFDPTEKLGIITYDRFQRNYSDYKLQKFDDEFQIILNQKEARIQEIGIELSETEKQIQFINNELEETKSKLNHILEKKGKWLTYIFSFNKIIRDEKYYKQKQIEQVGLIKEKSETKAFLTDERNSLYIDINKIKSDRSILERESNSEQNLKKNVNEDDFYEVVLDHSHSIFIQIYFDMQVLEVEIKVFMVEKKDGFIIPYDHSYSSLRSRKFRSIKNIYKPIQETWDYIERKINDLKELYKNNAVI
ncbi:hypothetical protein [Shimazuella kribbensis]|uniref:hypothetical protein n=1 Tax=Shimazuella kribbensis TaxID=139808 RepID=UPI00041936B0|nr:hypothetical protein [Shimazuella kribbensis]